MVESGVAVAGGGHIGIVVEKEGGGHLVEVAVD